MHHDSQDTFPVLSSSSHTPTSEWPTVAIFMKGLVMLYRFDTDNVVTLPMGLKVNTGINNSNIYIFIQY